ncbi:MAG: hypothetical protein CDV28_11628 [Candidatus Electronema aureum]|uniref:Uncharacterized protein n=1 Tax=Candidatus Electronema aureum TaxID=2005002 RepID=A0A521G1G8_9BACT|nr:MAG: hypothetical protein CDV28_11628 [Candidatus Electronema aureum]
MQCRQCGQKLEVVRRCKQVRLRCESCGREYRIQEVSADLDAEIEKQLERHPCIIYD